MIFEAVIDLTVTKEKAKVEQGSFSRDRIFTRKLKGSNVSKGKP